ncbi:hypothetical protein FRAHR75_300025 [Frankia sp. Hr75.2]|nr:hypothetical protein FRAHR75_300025 [Frankia sp. Hr75.2]
MNPPPLRVRAAEVHQEIARPPVARSTAQLHSEDPAHARGFGDRGQTARASSVNGECPIDGSVTHLALFHIRW